MGKTLSHSVSCRVQSPKPKLLSSSLPRYNKLNQKEKQNNSPVIHTLQRQPVALWYLSSFLCICIQLDPLHPLSSNTL